MYRYDEPHAILRDRMLGFEAKQVIEAEFREIPLPAPADEPLPRLAALKERIRRYLTGA